ncbi:MAG: hypothetical protein J0H85_08290 [Sediminibacterium magnilacihabitans]|jgi:hypothetical protein|nr:hypothetical protein [Sediminibacterium magnilacihabitans]PQV60733.1 hypothetical protein CLV53_106169 [Sediminibacterium magnilacihabitans]
MKYCLHFLALLFFPFLLQAQETTAVPKSDSTAKKDSTIKMQVVRTGPKYSMIAYTINNEVITNAELKHILNTHPASADEMRKYRGQNFVGVLLMSSFLSFMIVGAVQADHNKYARGSNFEKAPFPFSISLASLFGGTAVLLGNRHINKAIKAYNNQAIQ